MWEDIFTLAVNNGLWAVLFVVLLIYELKDSRHRETRYQNTIAGLTKTLSVVNEVKETTEELKQEVLEVKNLVKPKAKPIKNKTEGCYGKAK